MHTIVVVVIDMQDRLLNVMSDQNLLANSVKFLKIANELGLKIIATQQYTKGLGPTNAQIAPLINGKTFEKMRFSAFEAIKDEITDFKDVILIGVEAHVCVYQSAKDLLDAGYNVTLINECIASRDSTNKTLAFNALKGASIKSTEMLAFELLKSAEHPSFKDISKLIK